MAHEGTPVLSASQSITQLAGRASASPSVSQLARPAHTTVSLYGTINTPDHPEKGEKGAAAAASAASMPPRDAVAPPPKLSPMMLYTAATNAAEAKANMPWAKVFILGVLAGAYIALGCALAIAIGGGLPSADPGIQKLLFGLFFPVGLFIVIVSGAELVTGSLALLPVALIEGRISLKNLLKNWTFAYFGNLAGALLVAMLVDKSDVFPEGYHARQFTMAVTVAKSSLTFTQAFTRGFLCNWLVCLAVWNSLGANDIINKAAAIWPLVMGFVTMGFEHSVTNMFFLPLGWMLGAEVTAHGVIVSNIIVVTFGNLVGAVCMVTICYSLAYGRTGAYVAAVYNRTVNPDTDEYDNKRA